MRTGRCLCGAVAYELTVEPQMLALCHCRNCQRVSGGEPLAVMVAPAGSFRVTRGELKAYWAEADSGNRVDRNFCADCGTHIVNRLNAGQPFLAVSAGTLNERPALAPALEIWTSSAFPWSHHPEGTTRFEKEAG